MLVIIISPFLILPWGSYSWNLSSHSHPKSSLVSFHCPYSFRAACIYLILYPLYASDAHIRTVFSFAHYIWYHLYPVCLPAHLCCHSCTLNTTYIRACLLHLFLTLVISLYTRPTFRFHCIIFVNFQNCLSDFIYFWSQIISTILCLWNNAKILD